MALKLITKYTGAGGRKAAAFHPLARQAHQILKNGKGKGRGMRGWMKFPKEYQTTEEYARIKAATKKIKSMDGEDGLLLVIGIGGSYLGARAVIEALKSRYYNEIRDTGIPKIYFTGNTLSEADFADLDRIIGKNKFCINVISKSGKTLETAVAFRYFKAKLLKNCKGNEDELKSRIFVTTDPAKMEKVIDEETGKEIEREKEAKPGTLLRAAQDNKWEQRFVVPKNMGGRYSVLSAVGLLPIACACSEEELDELMRGAAAAQEEYGQLGDGFGRNACEDYAALRYYYYQYESKAVEIFASYEPSMVMFGEWYKQLFGESEGKRGKALFPAAVTFTTDLHSLGQYIQEGQRILFETVLRFEGDANPDDPITMGEEPGDGDRLNYLKDKTLHDINRTAFKATALAHAKGGCPSLVLSLRSRSAGSIGRLIYFFELSCAISGYMIEVNPFDQNGVEEYKKNMFALLGRQEEQDTAKREKLEKAHGPKIFNIRED